MVAHLARAERIEQFLANLVDRNSVDCRRLAIDLDRHLRIVDVEVAADVAQAFELRNLVAHFRRDPVQRVSVARLQRVLVLALRDAAGDVDVLDILEIHGHAGTALAASRRRRWITAVDAFALFPRLERDEHAPVVGGRIGPTRLRWSN